MHWSCFTDSRSRAASCKSSPEPRQVGKTTLVEQVSEQSGLQYHYASADEPQLRGPAWITQQWDTARLQAAETGDTGSLLILDEVQKVPQWAEAVKRLWDEDTRRGLRLKVVLLGSTPLLIGQGLTESLAGRFEVLHTPHWSFSEIREAFGWTLDQYLFYGAYPGAAPLIDQPARWARYILDSLIEPTISRDVLLIEPTISRDVLLLTRVDKPALLRALFELGCSYSGQILSYNKMRGQLYERPRAGNTTTLAHYLELLSAAGMLTGLRKYAGSTVSQRASSPKLQVLNTALMTATPLLEGLTFDQARTHRTFWGRLVESAVGSHLVNGARATSSLAFGPAGRGYDTFGRQLTNWVMLQTGVPITPHKWREANREVDFVVRAGRTLTAIEVKSGRVRNTQLGMDAFTRKFSPDRTLLEILGDGVGVEEFLSKPAEHWVGRPLC